MSHAIEFIETPMFTRQIKQIATDEELRELQKTLIESPDKGDLIQKPAGCEKSEWRRETREKAAVQG